MLNYSNKTTKMLATSNFFYGLSLRRITLLEIRKDKVFQPVYGPGSDCMLVTGLTHASFTCLSKSVTT